MTKVHSAFEFHMGEYAVVAPDKRATLTPAEGLARYALGVARGMLDDLWPAHRAETERWIKHAEDALGGGHKIPLYQGAHPVFTQDEILPLWYLHTAHYPYIDDYGVKQYKGLRSTKAQRRAALMMHRIVHPAMEIAYLQSLVANPVEGGHAYPIIHSTAMIAYLLADDLADRCNPETVQDLCDAVAKTTQPNPRFKAESC